MQEHSEPTNTIIIIRHGQSTFNNGYLNFLKDMNLDSSYTWQKALLLPGFSQAVSYSQKHFDSSLTEEGLKQCSKAKEELKDKQIDLVLVSPYHRALQTCNQIFGGRGIKVEVHPIFAEVFRFCCDIGHQVEQKRKYFPDFDFSHMNDSSELWFIDHIASHHQQKWNEHLKKHQQPLSYNEKQQIMLNLLKQKVIYESDQELMERILKGKQIIAQYSKKYKTIAIVSHLNIIRGMLSKEFNEKSLTLGTKYFPNATPIFTTIENLLHFK